MSDREGIEFRIEGRVQGVGFRHFTYRQAMSLGITGWAKNLADGSVLVHAQGDPESLARFREKIRGGPAFAKVAMVIESPLPVEHAVTYKDFEIAY